MTWFNNGEGIDKDIKDIVNKYEYLEKRIKALESENASLKGEHYQGEELSRLSNELKKVKEERWFSITSRDKEAIAGWLGEGRFVASYRFDIIPGIGYNGVAIANDGEEFQFYTE